MPQVKLSNLVGKLDTNLKLALEQAAGAAMNQNVPAIEVEHWLLQILAMNDAAFMQLLDQQKIDVSGLQQELNQLIERLPKGSEGQPTISSQLSELIESAWMLASVNFGHYQVSSLHLVLALNQPDRFGVKPVTLKSFAQLSVEALQAQISVLKTQAPASGGGAEGAPVAAGPVEGGALDKYTVNLTAQAREGRIDPISGRNAEVRKAIDILGRKRQNNPILVGEPGVGKTAVVEGLALRIAEGNVPASIQGVEIHSLDLGLLQAGASIKGEFENRLKDVINEVKNSPVPIIVFIDEAHTLIGAGGAAGQNDAANLLKPALARGEFRSIAATTWAEYKKYFEKDPALTRRFQVVKVEEPTAEDAIQMLRGVSESLSEHHGVFIKDEAIEAAVNLSIRYLPSRQLPDKAISLMDTACARIALTQGAKPEQIEQLEQRIHYIESELAAMEAEQALFTEGADVISALQEKINELTTELEDCSDRWEQEQQLVEQIRELKATLQQEHSDNSIDPAKQSQLLALLDQLQQVQGDEPLVHALVDQQTIASVISSWTGIPAGSMIKDEITKLLTLEDSLHKRVIGQKTAISELCKSIRISRAGLTDSRKPVGVFLMCGPSGVGKTETAMALADQVFGGGDNLTVINMTEFKEEHKISMLLGSPAGYVGFGEGGVLTEAIRRNPYSVLLLDEMEKAHPGIHDLFYQIFDKGHIKDSEGRTVDFRNTIIIMTSNAADQAICDVCEESEERPENNDLVERIRPELQNFFKPAFLGRATVIPYYPLNNDELGQITQISLNRIRKKLDEQYHASFEWDDALVEFIVGRNTDPTTGGRAVEQIINRTLMPKLAEECIARLSEGEPISRVHISVANGEIALDIQ
ncbi:type VI secretion system ATPase TssH [Oceanospirillum sediminis]|uniref:Type VI secretion system ATPase TssH n=1 Tax=Oceanospirillum sediminis TaxID=2760088 RepID=A0A839IQ90_9GAMM|nr:type VI secretion system ATPase TssH [Oceanospirillum sediminis]MBB1486607.1 type VI secretion system ATPase TssH [Oceanospirillum sediminis]